MDHAQVRLAFVDRTGLDMTQARNVAAAINLDEIQIEKLEAIGRGPDSSGEMHVSCEVTARYPATVIEPLARLRMVVVDETGEWPLAASESPLSLQGSAGQQGRLTLVSSLRTVFSAAVDVNDLGVRPTLLLYPIPWARVGQVALPATGRRQCDSALPCGELQVNRWWVAAQPSTGTFTTYEIGACIQNVGRETLTLGVVRIVLEDAKTRLLWSDLCAIEGIGPGEERVLSSPISVAGGPPLRGSNRIALSAGAVRVPVVVPLAVWQVEIATDSADSDCGHRADVSSAGSH